MRDYVIIGVIAATAIIIGTALYVFGPSSLQGDVQGALAGSATTTVPFTVLESGPNAISVTGRVNYQITSSNELIQLWPLIYGAQDNVPKLPQVDFSKYEVFAIFDGTHSTTGYSVAVSSVQDANGMRDVMITHSAPGTGCVTKVKTETSFVIIEVPITTYKLTHEDATTIANCQ